MRELTQEEVNAVSGGVSVTVTGVGAVVKDVEGLLGSVLGTVSGLGLGSLGGLLGGLGLGSLGGLLGGLGL